MELRHLLAGLRIRISCPVVPHWLSEVDLEKRAEADAAAKPVRLEVLTGSKADRFYLRHGFVKLREDAIEAEYERPLRNLGR